MTQEDSIPRLLWLLLVLWIRRVVLAMNEGYLTNYRLTVRDRELWLCVLTNDWENLGHGQGNHCLLRDVRVLGARKGAQG